MGATGVLAARGIVRVMDGAFEAAVTDLLVVAGRLEAGCAVRLGGLAMGFLAEAEYQLGDWSAAAQHAGLALRLTGESGRAGELSLLHAFAALVPVSRGDWEGAAGTLRRRGRRRGARGRRWAWRRGPVPGLGWRSPEVTTNWRCAPHRQSETPDERRH